MSEYCTIFGKTPDYAGVLSRVRRVSAVPVGVIGEEGHWRKLVLRGSHATLTLNSMQREKPGDDFSKLILSTHNFLSKVEAAAPTREAVLKAISSCAIAVGVVAEPALDERDGHMACVLDVAGILNGMIFNGSAMLDANGALLLEAKPSGRAPSSDRQ